MASIKPTTGVRQIFAHSAEPMASPSASRFLTQSIGLGSGSCNPLEWVWDLIDGGCLHLARVYPLAVIMQKIDAHTANDRRGTIHWRQPVDAISSSLALYPQSCWRPATWHIIRGVILRVAPVATGHLGRAIIKIVEERFTDTRPCN